MNSVVTAEKLKVSQQQMTLAAAAAKLSLWTWDIRADVIRVAPEGRPLHDLPREEEIDMGRFLATVHPDDRECLRRSIDNSLAGSGDFSADYRVVSREGELQWINCRGKVEIRGEAGPVSLSGVSMDVTERKQAEERIRLVVESVPYPVIMADSSATIVLVNKQTERTFGYSREELTGQPVELLIPARFSGDLPALRNGYFEAPLAMHLAFGREFTGRRKDGTEVPVEIGFTPMDLPEGRFVLVSVIDITRRLQSEQTLKEQRNELAHLSRVSSLGQLSGSLAHELNQPLGIILTNAQAAQRMLALESPDILELREILADIISEDRRAGEVIQRLRVLLKRGQTRLQPLDVNEVVGDVLRLLRSNLIGRGMTIRTALSDGMPGISGDYVQLQQVLLNLIVNAGDAMAENPPEQRELLISTTHHPGTVQVSLQDRGCGLPFGDATRIFEPFFTTKPQGLGIGLSICRSIVAVHQGRLWAEPNDGPGATFHLELPAVEPGV